MATLYVLIKTFLDPIIFVLISIAIGFVASSKSGRKQSVRVILTVTFLFLYIISINPVSNALYYSLENQYFFKNNNVDKLDVVIVLGGGISENKYIKETMPSYQTASRLLYAVQIFRKSEAKFLVCTGKGGGELSEAEVMGIAAERLGIPSSKIKIEPDSRDTWQHAQNLNNILQDKNIKIGLVTSAYHMNRSEREFRKYFPNIIPLPSDYLYSSPSLSIITFLPRTVNFYKTSIAVQEIIGIVWYKITG